MLGSVECPFETQFEETAVMELNRGVSMMAKIMKVKIVCGISSIKFRKN